MNFNPANYVDVQERINRFWDEHPEGAIVTRLMSPPDDFSQCRYEASVYKQLNDQRPSATGYAFETAGGGGANKTSHEENGETSAIGRALANMGYAKNRDDRPSRQEMNKVARGEPDYEAGEVNTPRGAELPPRDRTTTQNTMPQQQRADLPPAGSDPNLSTPRQQKFIQAIARELGMSDDQLTDELEGLYNKTLSELDRRDASAYIERMNSRRAITEIAS